MKAAAPGLSTSTRPDVATDRGDGEIVAINEAIEGLGRFDPRKEQVVELRFCGGLSVEEPLPC